MKITGINTTSWIIDGTKAYNIANISTAEKVGGIVRITFNDTSTLDVTIDFAKELFGL